MHRYPRYPSLLRSLRRPLAVLTAVALLSPLTPLSAWSADASRTVQGQDVIVIEGRDRTVYEYRQNGELRMLRIVPSNGRPYYLVPADETRGYGNLEQADTLLPRWILMEF